MRKTTTRPQADTKTARLLLRIGLAGWAAFSGLNAQAASWDDVAAAFGNTVLATYPDGRNQRIWLKEDGAYEAVGRRGGRSSGKWKLKGEKVCLKQSRPFPAPFSYCTAFPAGGGVGATWTGKDMAGVPIRLTLVPGVQPPPNGKGS
jgi:hypothetical protein